MAVRGRLREQLFNIRKEAEIQHAVGLVQHHDLDFRQRQQALSRQVQQTAGGSHDDLGARLDGVDLFLVRLSAIDGRDGGAAVFGCNNHVFGDLDRQFACGNHDERLDAGFGVVAQSLDEGQAKAESLAGTGLCLANDVLAGQCEGDGLFLNGEGLDDAAGCKCVGDIGGDTKITKSHKNTCLVSTAQSTRGRLELPMLKGWQ